MDEQLNEKLDLPDAVEAMLQSMDWLKPEDAAQVAIARTYAKQIHDLINDEDKAMRVKGNYLIPQLQSAVDALGGSPSARKELGAKSDEDEDPDEAKVKKMQSRAKGNAAQK